MKRGQDYPTVYLPVYIKLIFTIIISENNSFAASLASLVILSKPCFFRENFPITTIFSIAENFSHKKHYPPFSPNVYTPLFYRSMACR